MQREVVKWAQSLDLSFPIKNPRKDLANGFLVAEILSRYDKDVSMHSFGTELAIQQRINNWDQISKILERIKCNVVTKELIEGTIQQKGNMGRDLLDNLYMFLTKRTLKPNVIAPPVKTVLEERGFCRPTAAALLREANDATKIRLQQATGQIDQDKIRNANETLLQRHSVTLQSLKLAEPDRYQPRKNSYSAIQSAKHDPKRSEAHNASSSARTAKTNVREVEVRALDDDILHTFAERDQKTKEEALRSGFAREDDLSSALSRVVQKPLLAFGLTQDLDQLVPQAPEHAEYFQKFVLLRARIPVAVRGQCWLALDSAAKNIAKHVILRNDEFSHLVIHLSFAFGKDTAMIPQLRPVTRDADGIVDGDKQSAAYDVDQAFALFSAVGHHLVASSPEVAARVVEQYLVPAVTPLLLNGTAGVVQGVAFTLASYVHHHHLDGIRRLISLLEAALKARYDAKDRFILVAAHILRCVDFDHCLGVDVVARFYAMEGLGQTSPVARGAAVMMAMQAMEVDVVEASVFLDTICRCVSDPSWEVRLVALEFVLVYLRSVVREDAKGGSSARRRSLGDADEDPNAVETARQRDAKLQQLSDGLFSVRENVTKLIASFDDMRASVAQRRAALILAAKYLDNDVGSIDDVGMHLIPRLAREAAKDPARFYHGESSRGGAHGSSAASSSVAEDWIPGRVRSGYSISFCRQSWSVTSVAQTVGTMLESDQTGGLSTLHLVQLIEAIVLSTPNLSEDAATWSPFVQQVRETLIIAASNPGQCHGVADSELPLCAETSLNAIAKLFADFSGEVKSHDRLDLQLPELHSRGLEWLLTWA